MTKKNRVTANVFVEPHVREMMKHNARKDQRYSDYIFELIQYKKQHEKVTINEEKVAPTFREASATSNPRPQVRGTL